MSAVLVPEDYISVIRVCGRPILPPFMTENRRREMKEWRNKALRVSELLSEKPKTPEINPRLDDIQSEEETSPLLSAYASRFGSGMEIKRYLSGFVSNSPPPINSTNKPSPLSPTPLNHATIRASIAELDKERDESIQRFLEEQSRQLFNLKKSFAEQRRKLLQQVTPTHEKRSHSRVSSTTTRLTPKHKRTFAKLSALVKGYLVRRLMATVRVQDILSSLKDSLKMALQLHQEAARNHKSTESDINLHKTLLQQINRDVKKFHDIFFQLTTGEKMKLIAMDREDRKKEKPSKKRLSEATKQRLKQKLGDPSDVNKENRATTPVVGKSPQGSKRSEKSKASPKKHSASSKPSPRTMKNTKIKTSHVKAHN
uniref:Inner centromere protein Alike [Bombyx mori] n=1 Tax=Lepeophtheirus salmonis TaxID=72036 RepID=A0A0K2SZQ5_LEPSM